jgi:hypothetical protein
MPGAGAIHPIWLAFNSDGSRSRGAVHFVAKLGHSGLRAVSHQRTTRWQSAALAEKKALKATRAED